MGSLRTYDNGQGFSGNWIQFQKTFNKHFNGNIYLKDGRWNSHIQMGLLMCCGHFELTSVYLVLFHL